SLQIDWSSEHNIILSSPAALMPHRDVVRAQVTYMVADGVSLALEDRDAMLPSSSFSSLHPTELKAATTYSAPRSPVPSILSRNSLICCSSSIRRTSMEGLRSTVWASSRASRMSP